MTDPFRTLSRSQLEKLFAALGSEQRVHSLLKEFYTRMAQDVMIGYFFQGKDLSLIAARQAEFLLRAMGARPFYSGKPPAQAHDALPRILPGHFDRRLRILEELLQEQGLNAEDIRTWISFESAFRDSVVSN